MEKEINSKIFLIAIIAIVVIVLISNNINLTGAAVRDKLGGDNFCSYERGFICSSSQGDCDKDNDCIKGLKCVQNVGAKYGFLKTVDVCEGASSKSEKSGEVSGQEWGAEKIDPNVKINTEIISVQTTDYGENPMYLKGTSWTCIYTNAFFGQESGRITLGDRGATYLEYNYDTAVAAHVPYDCFLKENRDPSSFAECVYIPIHPCTGTPEWLKYPSQKDTNLRVNNENDPKIVITGIDMRQSYKITYTLATYRIYEPPKK